MTDNIILFLGLVFLAEVMGTLSGFGSSLLLVPLASLFLPYQEVLGFTAVFHVFSNLSKISLFRSGISKDIALKLGIPSVVGVLIGALLTAYIKTDILEICMNVVLLSLCIFLMVRFNKPLSPKKETLILGGAISGFLAGFAGSGGAVRGVTLAAFALPMQVFIATSAVIDLAVDSSRAAIYIFYGYFPANLVYMIPFLMAISYLGSWAGKFILSFASERVFRYIVLIVISLTTVYQIFHFIFPTT